ncbi:MoaD/ThiS family protein [Lutimonas sp.]|uniref:MoaD/ThiS family protein n=1 Tax=Lutimonas sp. TaxID=1872403 RepID=UPI003D9BCFA0
MKIKILFFGMSKDLAGDNNGFLDIEKDLKVSTLRTVLFEKFPLFSQMNSFAIAVNESYADEELTLVENDIVAIIPPVSGG